MRSRKCSSPCFELNIFTSLRVSRAKTMQYKTWELIQWNPSIGKQSRQTFTHTRRYYNSNSPAYFTYEVLYHQRPNPPVLHRNHIPSSTMRRCSTPPRVPRSRIATTPFSRQNQLRSILVKRTRSMRISITKPNDLLLKSI